MKLAKFDCSIWRITFDSTFDRPQSIGFKPFDLFAPMTLETNKPNGVGFQRILKATQCSLSGAKAAWVHESAFRQELLLVAVLFTFSFFISQSHLHWLILLFSLFFVLFAEVVNSALEAICDAVTLDHHHLIGRAKDLGSFGVMISLIFLTILWTDAFVGALTHSSYLG